MKKLNIKETHLVVGGFNCNQAMILMSYAIALFMAAKCAYVRVSVLVEAVERKKVSLSDLIEIEVGNFDVFVSFLGTICLGGMCW